MNTRTERIERLRAAAPVVLPSMLMCDFGNLEREVGDLEEAGTRTFHLDVMDGNFVPNLTYGMPIVAAMRKLTKLPLDVHLMISNPSDYIEAFAKAGADSVTFHVEAVADPRPVLAEIKSQEMAAGVVLNPDTPLAKINDVIDECDLVLIMSVQAGFGGQSFQPIALDKIKELRQRAGDSLLIEVDGGINTQTISACAEAGADMFVVGSGIFGASNYRAALEELTALAHKSRG